MTSNMPEGALSVMVVLGEEVVELRNEFMCWFNVLGQVDFRQTSLRRIGDVCLTHNEYLSAVTLPPSLTELGQWFLKSCDKRLKCVDLRNTALRTIGDMFACRCFRLTTVMLPDTVTDVGEENFLFMCGPVEVTSGSTTVRAAAAKHNADAEFAAAQDF